MKNHRVETKCHARVLVSVLVAPIVGAVALLWGWNTFAGDVLGQPVMKFKHALALEFLLLSVAGVFPFAWCLFGRLTS